MLDAATRKLWLLTTAAINQDPFVELSLCLCVFVCVGGSVLWRPRISTDHHQNVHNWSGIHNARHWTISDDANRTVKAHVLRKRCGQTGIYLLIKCTTLAGKTVWLTRFIRGDEWLFLWRSICVSLSIFHNWLVNIPQDCQIWFTCICISQNLFLLPLAVVHSRLHDNPSC